MPRIGFCTNVPDCDAAMQQERIQVPTLAPFVCPRCRRPLTLVPEQRSRHTSWLPVVVLLLVTGAAVAWWLTTGEHARPNPQSATPRGHVVLRLHGSNTIGERLAPALGEKFLGLQGATDISTLPGPNKNERFVQGTLPGTAGPILIEVQARGSDYAFKDLKSNSCDIGMASRPISSQEESDLAELGVMTSPASEHILGLDGLAIIVHRTNRVDTLTIDQVARIFSGEITDWGIVGGAAGKPVIYARDEHSGTNEMFQKMVLGKRKLATTKPRYDDSERLSEDVAADLNGIGFIGMPFIGSCKALKISDGQTTPLRPNPLSVRTEDYRLTRRLFLYTPSRARPGVAANPLVNPFIRFAVSDAGQAVVESAHFVGQALSGAAAARPVPAAQIATPNLPPHYAAAIAHAERLQLNFRFRSGSRELDNKALVDVGRVVQLMSTPAMRGSKIRLLGFSDSTGNLRANCVLSQQRAQAVADSLRGEEVEASLVAGFCAALPVASNETTAGRELNRRVEVWLQR
jgi:phosphate transport system substrate-binding protein